MLGASVGGGSTPGTGADLLVPGMISAVAVVLGGLLLALGIAYRRRTVA